MEFKGFNKIFSFTFTRQLKSKGYIGLTTIIAVILLILPIVITYFSSTASEKEYKHNIKSVYVCDQTENKVDFSILNNAGFDDFKNICYTQCDDLNSAAFLASKDSKSLILSVENSNGSFSLNVLLPKNTSLSYDDCDAFSAFLESGGFNSVLMLKSGLSPSQLSAAMTIPNISISEFQTQPESSESVGGSDNEMHSIKSILSMLLPYLNIMVLYFLILAYGQSIANSIVLEKTSKLMDTFLVSVKPSAMIFGKVLALSSAAILQFSVWIASIVGSLIISADVEKAVTVSGKTPLGDFLSLISKGANLFTPLSIILSVLMVVLGFLLFCSLSAIGGALASKQEDLSSTNALFSMALVISFLLTLYSGGIDSMGASAAAWLNFVPFTAVLVTPSRILLGQIDSIEAVISILITALSCGLFMLLAAKLYKTLVMYKGSPLSLSKAIKMLKTK